MAAGALFSAVLVLMAAQLALGRDPAVRSGHRAPATQTAQASPPAADSSIVDTILGLARGAISDDEGGSSNASPPAVQSTTS